MPLLGFSDKAIADYLPKPEDPVDPNAIVDPPKKPIVRVGDIWNLGEHRIMCGDSTSKETWSALMAGQQAAMVFTDPPYGVSYESDGNKFEVIKGDAKRRDDLYQMLVRSIGLMTSHTRKRGAVYIWHASSTRNDYAQAITAAGLVEKQYLIWAKPSMVLGRADYQWAHEPCFYCAHEGESPEFYGDRTGTTVWRIEPVRTAQAAALLGSGIIVLDGEGSTLFLQAKAPKTKKAREIRLTKQSPTLMISDPTGNGTVWEVSRDSSGYIHPTQKPVELATRAIENSSKPGEIVIDGFSGSGTTLIGCEMTGRRARVIDLDPRYVQAAIERWQDYAQAEATLEGDGRTYGQITKERTQPSRKSSGKKPAAPQKSRARSRATSPN
jgi:DNA modification methylase